MPTFYFLFFEDRRKGYGVTMLDTEEAEAMALDENNFDIPCYMTVPSSCRALYIPNVRADYGNSCYELNEILSDEEEYIIKVEIDKIAPGLTFYETYRETPCRDQR